MAKIVVADDNSNIQRMVGLALKDQGIDVVAVGNGEAAVRKISELHPDLVLADVFMPVRNGYEVCQYVKQDPKLAHIPVILLVGAFDPLDEQEAQRVGADGVLKKPFVPPDPLIAMVKAALFRAGVSLTPSTAEKGLGTPPPPPPSRGIFPTPPPPMPSSRRQLDVVPPKSPTPISTLSGVSFSGSSFKTPTPQAPETVFDDENLVETISRPEPVQIDAARNTMAFGDLLQPVSNNEAADFVVPTKPEIADDWNALEEPDEVPEEEEEESQESASTWRPEAPEGVFTADDTKGPVEDWRDSPVLQNVGRKSLRETWESAGHKTEDHAAESKGGFVNAADVPTEVDNTFVMETVPVETEPQRSNLRESPVHDSAVRDVAAHDVAAQEFRPHDAETESNPVIKTPAVSAFTSEPHVTEREAQKTETHRPEFVAEKSD
ncbi:MAG: response regulator, partial [Acidobacteriota bacterium]|nr:response regulator [Acidobacteriota bacterium]